MVKIVALGMFGLALCVAPLAASAHPLGNFTINHLTEVRFSRAGARVRYVLDLAEIPSYQAMREVSSGGKLNAGQLAAWAHTTTGIALSELTLTVDGKRVPLAPVDAQARIRPGAGGLPTLYLTVDAAGPLPPATRARRFTLHDATYAGRLGWHDAIAAPETEPTKELTVYPNALLGSPRATTSLTGTVGIDRRATVLTRTDDGSLPVANTASAPAAAAESFARSNQLSDMIARGTSDWGFVAVTFFVAIALGALHALEPGHGKTLLAISLVGARATVKQAAILAAALTIAHTIGVLALGLALNLFKGYFVPEAIYPWITLISGLVIAFIGARAIARELGRRFATHSHSHAHAGAHAHGHDHEHAHGAHDYHHGHGDIDDAEHAMLHAIPGTAPMRFGPTVLAAMSGGIAPCPAALVVLLAAIALNQVAYGIFVIIAFSFGLAGTLTALGIAVVRGASWLQGRPQFEQVLRYGPLLSAAMIALIGSIMIGQGFMERGVQASPVIVSLIVLLVIAGYVFSHPFGHRHVELG